jgi:hypothetical protein
MVQLHCPWEYAQSRPFGVHDMFWGTSEYVAGHVPVGQVPPVSRVHSLLSLHRKTWLQAESGLLPYSHSAPWMGHVPPTIGGLAGHAGLPMPPELLPELPELPLEPLEPLDPLDPLEPLEPLDPLDPPDPLDPLDPPDPLDPLDPPEPLEDPLDPLEPLLPELPPELPEPEPLDEPPSSPPAPVSGDDAAPPHAPTQNTPMTTHGVARMKHLLRPRPGATQAALECHVPPRAARIGPIVTFS